MCKDCNYITFFFFNICFGGILMSCVHDKIVVLNLNYTFNIFKEILLLY